MVQPAPGNQRLQLYIRLTAQLPAAARILDRRPTTALKPAEMFCTVFDAPQVSHVNINIRFSRLRIVSGDRQVVHVTYSPANRRRRREGVARKRGLVEESSPSPASHEPRKGTRKVHRRREAHCMLQSAPTYTQTGISK